MAEVIEAKPVHKASEMDSNRKLIAAAAWLFAPIGSLLVVLLDNYKKDEFIQFHAWQSLVLGVISIIVWGVLFWTCILPLAVFVVQVIGIVKAFQGEMWKLPVIGDWAEEQAKKAVGSASK